MPDFSYFLKVRVDLSKFSSPQALIDAWYEEAQAVAAAGEQMNIQLWKDASEPTVYGIATIEAANAAEAHADMLSIFTTVPMGANGQLIVEEVRSVLPYPEWAAALAGRASG
jgi:aspartate aminotransferase-like enzyme